MELQLKEFRRKFAPDTGSCGPAIEWSAQATLDFLGESCDSFTFFLQHEAKSSYNNGSLRFQVPGSAISFVDYNGPDGWASDWPAWKNKLRIFAHDWQGNLIGFDMGRRDKRGELMICVLEIGTGAVLEFPANFQGFVESLLIEHSAAVLLGELFEQWREANPEPLLQDQCAGYKVPLFLGGNECIDNLEVIDLRVQVSLMGQLRSSIT